MARTERVDLVLLDIGMSDMNGYELCRMLKNDPQTQQLPIVFLTAFSSQEDEAHGLEAGAVDYIAKPINPAIVRARVATQVTLKLQRDMLEQLVRQDPLTSLLNRRGLDDILTREWRRAARGRLPLSLVLLDVDSFKAFNDHYGHIAGDECLIKVAHCLQSQLKRGGDYLFRYGGEEFAVLLADTPFDAVGDFAEGLRAAIEALQVPHQHSAAKDVVTISIGAATTVPHPTDDPMGLLLEADRMLYAVKDAGRNAVRVSDLGKPEEKPPISAVESV